MIQLTTPFNPGDVDSGRTYPHVKVTEFHFYWTVGIIEVICQYGEQSGNTWSPGKVSNPAIRFTGTAYTELVSTLCPDDTTPVYVAAYAALYDKLITENHFSGTVVTD